MITGFSRVNFKQHNMTHNNDRLVFASKCAQSMFFATYCLIVITMRMFLDLGAMNIVSS